ncbi:MAG: NADPH:quinone oxidoreductase family protein [Proteobacteria bacterium]|nr:NADPH:quinone oxidoreductase family protein [Pseudomonadota bacterium]
MKAVRADALDSVADYRLVELPTPEPGPGEVRIKVAACGVGYVDALVSLGRYQVKPPLPHIPGGEAAGVVDAVGAGVTGLAAGDRVMAQVGGGFAEYAVARAPAVVKIPDAMAFEAACGFRINYVTALHGLRDRAALKAGERLLVSGAAGGVGAAAVQLGKILGAEVIACASSEDKRAFALSLGADKVIDTAPDGWRDRLKALTEGKGVDVYFDPVCGPLFELAFRSMAWGGRHLVVGFVGGPIPALPANLTLMKGAALVGVDVRQFMLFEGKKAQAHLAELLGWVAEGRLNPPVGRRFAFDDYAAALEFALSGQGLGKTVLTVG